MTFMKGIRKKIYYLIFFVYLFFALSSVFTLQPNVDEAWFTNPAYNLVEHGFFGTTVLDETATFRKVRLDGINHHTYWVMPIYPLVQVAVGKIASFGLIQTRSVSIFFGLVALLAWAYLIKKLTNNHAITLLAVGLMAIDYHFVYAASEGRMDMMTAALGVIGLALFIRLRLRSFTKAILFSFAFEAFAFFTHPMGLIWALSLLILVVSFDFKQIRIRHFTVAALPFVVLGVCWLVYIEQNPDLFYIQFGGNASDRWGFFSAPLTGFWQEICLRYLYNFGIGEGLSGGGGQIKILILLSYLFSILGGLVVKSLRKDKFIRFILIITGQEFLMLAFLDSMKQSYYLIHIVPTLSVILAVWINWLWSKTRVTKALSIGFLAVVLFVNLGVNLVRVKRDEYHAYYLPFGQLLNQKVGSSDLVMGSAELWFAIEKKENLLDDYRLGYMTGKRANFIVVDAPRYKDWISSLESREPQTYTYIQRMLNDEFKLVYENNIYQLYGRAK